MGAQRPRYLAYLLRLWQVEEQGRFAWRASLEHAHTGEHRGFPDLESLIAFLASETENSVMPEEPARDTEQSRAEPLRKRVSS